MVMEEAAAAEVPLGPALNTGDLVEIHGLKAAELNGAQGQLLRLDEEAGRWQVRLQDGEVKAVKPENLAFKGVGRIEDDGTLALIGMATDHKTIQSVVLLIESELQTANEAVQLLGLVIAPRAATAGSGDEVRIWLKLAQQAEQKLRGALEDFQKNIEAVDGIQADSLGAKAAGELKMARRDLVRFVQSIQERLESALSRLRPVLKQLTADLPAPKHGWTPEDKDSAPLHEKYRHVLGKEDSSAAPAEVNTSGLSPITVKYQGRGENPPPSDNLYVKGLPGWVTEEDLQAMFSKTGSVQSMKLKAAEWGAIAFVRLTNRKEAAVAIEMFNGKVPDRLAERAEVEEGKRLEEEIVKVSLQAVVDQLAKGITVVIRTSQPLGIRFDNALFAESVEDGSQAAEAGVRRGWRLRTIGGHHLASPQEVLEKLAELRKKGLQKAALAFSPPPVVLTLTTRPFGLALGRDPDLGLVFVREATGPAAAGGVRPGAVVTAVGGKDVSGMQSEQVVALLREATLPVKVLFEQACTPGDDAGETKRPAQAAVAVESENEDMVVDLVEEPEPEENRLVTLVFRLDQPFGILFDDMLKAKSVQEGSQAQRAGVDANWRVRAIDDELLRETTELMSAVKRLKASGAPKASLVFYRPKVQAGGSSSSAAPAGLPERTLSFDLGRPLGIFFDEELSAQTVQDGSQAAELGVAPGWRVLSVGGELVRQTPDLVARIQALRAGGEAAVRLVFGVPGSDEASALDAVATPAVGSGAVPKKSEVVVLVDLSKPLGIFFDDHCSVKSVQEGSQAALLGVREGWVALKAGDDPLATTADLVSKIGALKAQGAPRVSVVFQPATGSESKCVAAFTLSDPFGLAFEDDLVIAQIQGGSQAELLGIQRGWRLSEIGGSPFSTREELVARIQELRAQDEPSTVLSFLCSTSNATESATEAGVVVEFDLSRPLGIGFDDELLVGSVQGSSQAQQCGVREGWRALTVAGEAVQTLPELVAKVQAAKAANIASLEIRFMVPSEQDSGVSEPPEKRQRVG